MYELKVRSEGISESGVEVEESPDQVWNIIPTQDYEKVTDELTQLLTDQKPSRDGASKYGQDRLMTIEVGEKYSDDGFFGAYDDNPEFWDQVIKILSPTMKAYLRTQK